MGGPGIALNRVGRGEAAGGKHIVKFAKAPIVAANRADRRATSQLPDASASRSPVTRSRSTADRSANSLVTT